MTKNEYNDNLSALIGRIIRRREQLGYSLENMAYELGLSLSAYNKIEKQQTKLTVERLYIISIVLDVEISELLGINTKYQLNQTNKDSSTGYLQQIDNFHQENREVYEKLIQSKDEQIIMLKKMIKF